jgi:hypothetical protein
MLSEYAIRNCIFGFKCEADWEKMIVIRGQDEDEDGQTTSEIRFCKSCQKEVYQCDYDEELLENIHLNRCIRIAANPWFPPLMGAVKVDYEK